MTCSKLESKFFAGSWLLASTMNAAVAANLAALENLVVHVVIVVGLMGYFRPWNRWSINHSIVSELLHVELVGPTDPTRRQHLRYIDTNWLVTWELWRVLLIYELAAVENSP